MNRRLAFALALSLVFFLFPHPSLDAAEPGFELAKTCRANLGKLREAVDNAIKAGTTQFPTWGKMQDVYTMILTNKYLPEQPKPPTADCEYYLVFKDPSNFDWYCNLHGLIGGDSSVTFRYHEFQFTAYTNSKFMNIPKYKTHADNLLRWVAYEPTLIESFKYHYARNPMTTLLMAVGALLFVLFIWRNIFT
ncbi:MAG TPA: hypothetical protein PLP29_17965 [Candidatus Ozemobacteraceae bacterium]|nr:hypothetical protein [Candidatus Ozemobacteraceae bacterium]